MIKKQTVDLVREFVDARDWGQFHTPENLSKSISIEAAELLELFQWSHDADLDAVAAEIADVATYLLLLCDHYNFDLETLILKKLAVSQIKYPIDKSKGVSTKYDKF